jgi:hypothetical protein
MSGFRMYPDIADYATAWKKTDADSHLTMAWGQGAVDRNLGMFGVSSEGGVLRDLIASC